MNYEKEGTRIFQMEQNTHTGKIIKNLSCLKKLRQNLPLEKDEKTSRVCLGQVRRVKKWPNHAEI